MKKFNKSSSSHQDIFAYTIGGENGYYLEIGGSDGYTANNTYALEKFHNWKGVSIEINEKRHSKSWISRTNSIIWDSALTVDYEQILRNNNIPLQIDYLQVDIEPASRTFEALERVLDTNIKFKCCTFEHDSYAMKKDDIDYKVKADELMLSNGYKIAVENVLSRKNKKYYETWYVTNEINYEQRDWNTWQQEVIKWAGLF